MRDLAKSFHKMEVNNGKQTYFWYDNWSSLGCLKDLLRDGGSIALGIEEHDLVGDVLTSHRRKRHRFQILNEVENEIDQIRSRANQEEEEVPLWRPPDDKYSKVFSTKKTWLSIRQSQPECGWSKGVWFSQATPKYSFLVWVAIKNRLQTMDRILSWNSAANGVCVLCQEEEETCQHLFFSCKYSSKIWREMIGGILKEAYTTRWTEIIDIISRDRGNPAETFIVRYAFQVLAHSIWRERNGRRHREQPNDEKTLAKMVDKMIRLKLLLVKGRGKKHFDEALMKWLATRI